MQSAISKRWVTSALALLLLAACARGRDIHGTREDPPGAPVKDAAMFDARSGWVLTEGRFVMTDNGGETWHDLTPIDIAAPQLRAAFFTDVAHGWLVGESPRGKLRIYIFGNGSWVASEATIEGSDAAIHFDDEHDGWLAVPPSGSSGRAFRTNDGGTTWNPAPVADRIKAVRDDPCCAGRGAEGLPKPVVHMTFGDPKHGWAVAASPRALYATSDGGKTWRKLQP